MTVRSGRVEEHHARQRLPIGAASPGAARRFTGSTLSTWGLDAHGDVAALLVSELVTNAVHHGRTTCLLELTATPTVLRVAVADDGGGAPRLRYAGPEDDSGRGLAIVEALASRWGFEPTASGKVVWCELRLESVSSAR
jgi:anti-sigma regulatory factor (Ser/Thr protein kinase)